MKQMNDQSLFKRIAAIAAIVSAPVALGSWILAALALGADVDSAFDMAELITLGAPAAAYLHLAWTITDSFGYLLLLAPAALYLWYWLKPRRHALVTLYTISGFFHILIGMISVNLLSGLAPPMMRAYFWSSSAVCSKRCFTAWGRSHFSLAACGGLASVRCCGRSGASWGS
jgi:hypothetical protein